MDHYQIPSKSGNEIEIKMKISSTVENVIEITKERGKNRKNVGFIKCTSPAGEKG